MTKRGRWKRKAEALARLAEDQQGKPEGVLARQKLLEVIEKHPEAASYGPVVELGHHDVEWIMTGAHFVQMKRAGVDTTGEWTGDTLEDAIKAMMEDYKLRYRDHFDVIKLLVEGGDALFGGDSE